jgi:hypothetical protein
MHEFFGKRIVGRGIWPPRYPDITPPDFFMWEFLKERVYSNSPLSLDKVKHNAEQTFAKIYPETLRKVARNTLKRADACLRDDGGHFQKLKQLFCHVISMSPKLTHTVVVRVTF